MSITKKVLLNWYSPMKKKIEKDSDNFWCRKLTLKVRILQFSTTYTRPKNFLLGSSLAFTLKEGSVRCAKVCNKSWVILNYFTFQYFWILTYLQRCRRCWYRWRCGWRMIYLLGFFSPAGTWSTLRLGLSDSFRWPTWTWLYSSTCNSKFKTSADEESHI